MADTIAQLNQRYEGRLVAVGVNCSCGACLPITPSQATRGIWKALRVRSLGEVTLDLVGYPNVVTASKSGVVIFLYPTDEKIDLKGVK